MRALIVDSADNSNMYALDRLLKRWFPGMITKRVDSQSVAEAELRAGFAPDFILVAGRSRDTDGRTGPMIIEQLRQVYTAPVVEIVVAGSLGIHATALDDLDKVRRVHRVLAADFGHLRAILTGGY